MYYRSLAIFCISLVFLLSSSVSRAQSVYSYVDEHGVRILTNIPPKNPEVLQNVTGWTNSEPSTRTSAPAQKVSPSVDAIIDKYAGEFKLDPSLVRSMIWQESGFNPKAVSRKGAQGLMQLMPATAARIGVRNTFDPEENIRGGMKHLRGLLDMFGDNLELSLAAYNAGENLVQRIGRIPNIRETSDYVRSITKRYGDKKMNDIKQEPQSQPRMFRFTDASGVLHLTNIPPVTRETSSNSTWVADGQSLQ